MKCRANSSDLEHEVSFLRPFAASAGNLLGLVSLEVTNNVSLQCHVGPLEVTTALPALVAEPGVATVGAAPLAIVARCLPDPETAVSLVPHRVRFESGSYRADIPTKALEYRPYEPRQWDTWRLRSVDLLALHKRTVVAAPEQAVATFAMLQQLDGGARMIVVDRSRMAIASTCECPLVESRRQLLIPPIVYNNLPALIRDNPSLEVEIREAAIEIEFACGARTIRTRTMNTPFPPFARAVPAAPASTATCDIDELRRTLRAVIGSSQNEWATVRVVADQGGLTVDVVNDETDARGVVVAAVTHEACVYLNGGYFRKALAPCGDGQVTLEMNGSRGAVIIRSQGYVAAISPIRM